MLSEMAKNEYIQSLESKVVDLKEQLACANDTIKTYKGDIEFGDKEILRLNKEIEAIKGTVDNVYTTIKHLFYPRA